MKDKAQLKKLIWRVLTKEHGISVQADATHVILDALDPNLDTCRDSLSKLASHCIRENSTPTVPTKL